MVWKRGQGILSGHRTRPGLVSLVLVLIALMPFASVGAAEVVVQGCGTNLVPGSVLVPTGIAQVTVGDRTDHTYTNYYIPNVGQDRYTMFWDTSDLLRLQSYGVTFWRDDGSGFPTKVGGPHVPSAGVTMTIPANTNLVIVWLRTGPEMPLNGDEPASSDFSMLLEGCRTR